MKRHLYSSWVFCAGLLLVSSPASAAWYWTHGHSAHVQWEDRVVAPDNVYFGWGTDVDLKPGLSNWVQLAIPTPGNLSQGARYIRLRFYTGSVDAFVSDIHIWNGEEKVKEFAGNWSNGWKTVTLDLGAVTSFSKGLGVSIQIKAGVENLSHRFIFAGAGANFVNKP